MKKFIVCPCMKIKNEEEEGNSKYTHCSVLSCIEDPTIILMFPINSSDASLINYVLGVTEKQTAKNIEMLGLYDTMLNSWESSGIKLGGVYIAKYFNKEKNDEFIFTQLMMVSQLGEIDGMIDTSFIHSVVLAALQDTRILIDEGLLATLLPDKIDDEKSSEVNKFNIPEDENLVDIVKRIMSGDVKKE